MASTKAAKKMKRNIINKDFYDESFKAEVTKYYRSGKPLQNDQIQLIDSPFHCCVVNNFISDDNFLQQLKDDLLSLKFNEKSNDLYKFEQSDHLKKAKAGSVQTLQHILYNDFSAWLKDVTGIEFTQAMDFSCAKYNYTDVLLCHDDELEGRRIAFILYLVPPWNKEDGGTLDLFSVDDNGQPAEIEKVLVPKWNSLTFFEVTPVSFHQVAEVLSKDKCRLSVSGWLYGEPVPRPITKPEPRRTQELPKELSDDVLLEWINPMYLNTDIVDSIQEQLEENSEIQLSEFILEEKYNLIVKELESQDLKWVKRGPANKRNYESIQKDTSLPEMLGCFVSLMHSKPMFKLLTRLTGLKLAELESDEENSKDENAASSSNQNDDDMECKSQSNPGCYSEIRHWSHGFYTLVHDTDPHLVDFALDAILFFRCDEWDSSAGGFTSYIASEEDEELLTVYPTSNCLALVYRDKETLRFVKHINHSCNDHSKTSNACSSGLGMDARNEKIPDKSITASSEAKFLYARFGRLNEQYSAEDRNFGGWCAYDCQPGQVQYLQVDLGKAKTVTEIETQAVFNQNMWVTSYSLSYSYDGLKWFDRKVSGKGEVFPGNTDRYSNKKNKVDPPVTARFLRILPSTFVGSCPCMRVELYGCQPENDCSTGVGINANIRKIPNNAMTASSEYRRHFAYEGRLHNTFRVSSDVRSWGAWCSKTTDKSPYLQIDLGRVRVVSGVSTQGYGYRLWTTQYKLNYSVDGVVWKQYMEQGAVKLFVGNSDNHTLKTRMFLPTATATARFVRFIPTKWNKYPNEMPCLRVEVYECSPIKGSVPTITTGISNQVVKRGKSFNLTCVITGQPLIEVTWLKNGKSLSTTDMMSISGFIADDSYHTSLDFSNIKMGEDGNRYSCAANYPGVNIQAISTAQITVDGTIPVLKILKIKDESVEIELGLQGALMTDITGYEVSLVDFTSSDEIIKTYPLNASSSPLIIQGLKPFTKYNINVCLVYSKSHRGSRIPNQQFRTMDCKPKKSPVSLAMKHYDQNSLEIHWQDPADVVCKSTIVGYDVRVTQYDTTGKITYTSTNSTTEKRFVLSPLEIGSKYNLAVSARTVAGNGPYTTSSVTFVPVPDRITKSSTVRLVTTTKFTFTPKPIIEISNELVKIKQAGVTNKNALNVTIKVEQLTNKSKCLDTKDISLTADILEDIVKTNGTDRKIGESLVRTVSNILNANQTVLEQSYKENNTGVRYVKILENWLEKVNVDDQDISETSQNVIIKKINIYRNKIKSDIVFEEKGGASVTVPVDAIQPRVPGNNSTRSNQSIYFVYYKKNSFFGGSKVKTSLHCINGFTVEEKLMYTPVLASSIVGRDITNLSRPITLRFKENQSRKNIEKAACVFWDFNAKGGTGGWSSKGCKLHKIVNKTIICHCNHMTNFAAMMDVYAKTSKACGDHGKALSYISVVGCFISLIGLFLTILTYAIFRRLRREIAAKIMLQLCFAIFVVIVLFLTGLERTKEPIVCLAIGISLHYFTLVAFMWMFMEAVFMYHAFVIVWPPRENNDLLKCTLAAWGLPGIVVTAVALSSLDHYRGKHYCRVHGAPFFAGFLAPICLILLINFVIFAIIMYKLSKRPTRSVEHRETSEATQRLKRAFGIMILMGLTWMFGAFAISEARLVFQYLFAVCNSLQGFAIFIFYCLSQKSVRDAWVAFITCDTRSELKIRTDSYYERRRLSSSASQKTSTLLPRTRTNSSTVMMRHDSMESRTQEVQAMLNEQIKMQTIQELDVEDRYIEEIGLSTNDVTNSHQDDYDNDHCSTRLADVNLAINLEPMAVSISSAEDEASKLGSQVPLQPYNSYRALSDVKEVNALLKLADKRKSSSKSNEMLVRKSLFIAGSSPLLQAKDVARIRAAKSCDNVNKPKTRTGETIDFGTLKIKNTTPHSETRPLIDVACGSNESIEMSKSEEALRYLDEACLNDNGTLGSTYKNRLDSRFNTLESDGTTIVREEEMPQNEHQPSTSNNNKTEKTKAPDSTTPTTNTAPDLVVPDLVAPDLVEPNSKDAPDFVVPDLFPACQNSALHNYPTVVNSSHDNIVRWLHDTADDVASDTSDEYRSSMCSSLNDINSGVSSCRSSVYSEASSRRSSKGQPNPTDSPLGRLVVGPLRGSEGRVDESNDNLIGNGKVSHLYNGNGAAPRDVYGAGKSYASAESIESERTLHSDEGYSASEEENNLKDRQIVTKNRRRTKSRSGSLAKSNGFIKSAYV
eukprot:gene7942-8797_t